MFVYPELAGGVEGATTSGVVTAVVVDVFVSGIMVPSPTVASGEGWELVEGSVAGVEVSVSAVGV